MAPVTPKYSRPVKCHTPACLDFLNSRTKPVEEVCRDIDILAEHPDLLESDNDQFNDDQPHTLEDEASYSMGFGPTVDGEQGFNTEIGGHLSLPEGFTAPSLFGSPSIYENRPISQDIPAQQHENGRELPDYFNTSVAYEPSSTLFQSTTPLRSPNGREIPDRFNHDELFPQYPLQSPSPLECPTVPTAPDFIYPSSMAGLVSLHQTRPREYNNDGTPELYNNTTDLHPYNLSQSTVHWRPNCHGTPGQYQRNSPQSTTSAEKPTTHAMPDFAGRAEGQILTASSTSSLERYFTGEEHSANYHPSSQLNRHIYGGDLEPALRASFQSPFDVNNEPSVNSGNESSSANAHEYNSTRFPSWRNSRPLSFGSLRSATSSLEGTTLGRGIFPSTLKRPLDSLLQPLWPPTPSMQRSDENNRQKHFGHSNRAGPHSFESNPSHLHLTSSPQVQLEREAGRGNKNTLLDREETNKQSFIINTEEYHGVSQESHTIERGCSFKKRPCSAETVSGRPTHQRERLNNCTNSESSTLYAPCCKYIHCLQSPAADTNRIEYGDDEMNKCTKENGVWGNGCGGTAPCCSPDCGKWKIERVEQKSLDENNATCNSGEECSLSKLQSYKSTWTETGSEDYREERTPSCQNADMIFHRIKPTKDREAYDLCAEMGSEISNPPQLSTTANEDGAYRDNRQCTQDPSLGTISTTVSAGNGYRISDPDPALLSSSCAPYTASTTEDDGYGCSTRYTQSVPDLCAVGIRATLDHEYEDNDPYIGGTLDHISQRQSPATASIDHEYGEENVVPNSLPDLISSSSDEEDALCDVELSSNNPSHSSEEEWVAISNQILGENTEIERYYTHPGSSWADLSRDIHTVLRRMEPQRAIDAVPLLGRIALERAWEWGHEEQQLRNVETVEREDNWVDVAEREYR